MKNYIIYIAILFCFTAFQLTAKEKHTDRDKRTYQLSKNLEEVWPLVNIVSYEYRNLQKKLPKLSEEQREEFLSGYEKKLGDEYYDQLKALSHEQRKLLLLLIHRETGKTPFELLTEFRSGWHAACWQALARLFGADLKQKYRAKEFPFIEQKINILAKNEKNIVAY